jgi:hypothetical protein
VSRADPLDPNEDVEDIEDADDADEPLRRFSLPGALRAAAVDLYYQSVRLVPANLLWTAVLLGLAWAAVAVGLWLAILALPLLALPVAGIYRLAGLTVRGEDVVLSDAVGAMRELLVPALLLGVVVGWGTALLTLNVATGLNSGSPLGWGLAIIAGWGLVAMLDYAVVAWPLLADPARSDMPSRERARLAGYVLLVSPWRMTALAILTVLIGAIATIFFAAIATIGVAYLALLSCRVVLADADRLSERLAGSGDGAR